MELPLVEPRVWYEDTNLPAAEAASRLKELYQNRERANKRTQSPKLQYSVVGITVAGAIAATMLDAAWPWWVLVVAFGVAGYTAIFVPTEYYTLRIATVIQDMRGGHYGSVMLDTDEEWEMVVAAMKAKGFDFETLLDEHPAVSQREIAQFVYETHHWRQVLYNSPIGREADKARAAMGIRADKAAADIARALGRD